TVTKMHWGGCSSDRKKSIPLMTGISMSIKSRSVSPRLICSMLSNGFEKLPVLFKKGYCERYSSSKVLSISLSSMSTQFSGFILCVWIRLPAKVRDFFLRVLFAATGTLDFAPPERHSIFEKGY